MTAELLGVDPRLLDRFWPQIAEFIGPAVDRCGGLYALDDVRQFCGEMKMQLWAVVRNETIVGALVTEVVVYPRRKCLWIAFAGGAGISDCPEIVAALADWGSVRGCAAIRCEGRRGWTRAGGFIETGVVMWRAITKETLQ